MYNYVFHSKAAANPEADWVELSLSLLFFFMLGSTVPSKPLYSLPEGWQDLNDCALVDPIELKVSLIVIYTGSCTKHKLQSLIGSLNHIASLTDSGRTFLEERKAECTS